MLFRLEEFPAIAAPVPDGKSTEVPVAGANSSFEDWDGGAEKSISKEIFSFFALVTGASSESTGVKAG